MWAKYCEIIDNNLCAEHVHPLGQPDDGSAGHHDLLHLLVAGIQEILRTEKWVSRCQSFLHLYSTTLLCTHNGFWKHHILFLPKMHKSLYAMWGRMHRTWQNLWKREDDISQSESKHHFSLWYLGTRHQSHAFVEPHNLNSVCHHWNDLYLRVLHFNLNLSSKSDFMTVHFKNVPLMIIF